MYIIRSETFIEIDSLQHLKISRQTYPTNKFLPGKDNLMLIKITGESVKFIESKYIFRELYKYEFTALHIIAE